MYVCIYLCMYVCMYVCVCGWMDGRMDIHTYVCLLVFNFWQMHIVRSMNYIHGKTSRRLSTTWREIEICFGYVTATLPIPVVVTTYELYRWSVYDKRWGLCRHNVDTIGIHTGLIQQRLQFAYIWFLSLFYPVTLVSARTVYWYA